MVATIPTTGFIRQAQLLSNKKTGYQGPLPISASTLWRWVAKGKFPKPVKLSDRVTAWRAEEVSAWLQEQGQQAKLHNPLH